MVIAGTIDDVLAKIKGTATLHVEVLNDVERLGQMLDAHPKVHSHSLDDGTVRIEFTGTDDDVADLHRDLVMAGIRVKSFYEKKDNLEDIFLKVGAHEVS